MIPRCRPRDERGAQAVEFALLFLFALGPILYGLIAFGFILNFQITASQLAREAARAAAICAAIDGEDAAACAQAAFDNRAIAFPGTLESVDGECADATSSATATVAVAPPLPFFGLDMIRGRSKTPCGG